MPRENNRNRNNNRKRNNNQRNNKQRNNNQRPKDSGNSKRKRFSKNRRPKKLTPTRVLIKYQNLMDQYLTARKKFFDIHGVKNPQQVAKAERNYKQSLNELREFEHKLEEDWQKEILQQNLDHYPEDRQYSSEHNLAPVGDEVSFVGEFEDPHLLADQKTGAWNEDTEESSGSMDDYYAYKGITPPAPVEEDPKQ